MSAAPLIAAFVWLIAANVIAMLPSRDKHWRNAYGLIAVGVPILGWVTYVNGPLIGLMIALGGASVLRWPLVYAWRWVRGVVKG